MTITAIRYRNIFFAGLAMILLLSSFTLAEKGPRIKFKETTYDFGKIKQGDVRTHVFVFENVGDAVLKINKVSSSCGCTAALVSDKKLKPGKKGEIKATFNSRGFRGKITKYIYIESNDPIEAIKTLSVKADIEVPPQPEISLDKYSYDVGLVVEGEEMSAKTKITNKGELELKVTCTHADASFFSGGKKVSFPLKIPSGKSKELEIRIPARIRKGLVREYIIISSNDPNRQSLSFFIRGYIITKDQLKKLFQKYKDILK